ncbi:MAG: aldolase/citrate lyase family protein [Candidatus Hatepunaea meridiana]|nr:aldolase/citrate lyase family protein [Candidatus Hatepunaea meridiana]
MPNPSHAGRKGDNIRSDCWVSFESVTSGGFNISVRSKVESMYGDSIMELCRSVLAGLGVNNARLELQDYGALPFTIAARIETAVRRAGLKSHQCLPEMKEHSRYPTTRDRFRRSRLYLPGNDPKLFINAGLHKPDGIILDLEDSVAPKEKDAARIIVRNALRQVNFYGAERMVRINQGNSGLGDLMWTIPHNVHVILIPKVEKPEQVINVDSAIKAIARKTRLKETVYLMPIIESAMGGLEAYRIATASENIVALALGLEDYTADIGTQRTNEGRESFWLRSIIVNAARAAGIQPIDTVFSDVSDMEGLRASVIEAKSLGFDGKGCIHPRQIAEVHKAFAPSETEISRAKKIVLAFDKAEKEGLGVVSLGSKMIDPPVVKRAMKTVEMAETLGLLEKNWRSN